MTEPVGGGSPVDDVGGWPAVLGTLTNGEDLTAETSRAAMATILDGGATSAQIAGLIVALRMKGETIAELSGLRDAMLAAAERVPLDADRHDPIDMCGTGGDRSGTINVSTIAALVVAGAGVEVVKHGNRAASSQCGSADVLEELGVAIELGPEGVAACVEEAGIGFCFARRFHPAMRHVGPTRQELGVPTVFNVLGPMSNPAGVRRQVLGVSDPTLAHTMLGVLAGAGTVRALVVHGADGLDELSTTGPTTVHELDDGDVRTFVVDPEELGLTRVGLDDLRGGDAAVNADAARAVLAGTAGPHRDIVLLNAAAGLMVAGRASTWSDGLEAAAVAVDDGRAAAALDRLVTTSQHA